MAFVEGEVECLASVALTDGDLRWMCESRPSSAYDAEGDEVCWLENQQGDAVRRIASLAELRDVLAPGALHAALTTDPAAVTGFARMIAWLLDLGRVVELAELYAFLEPLFGVDVHACTPRLDGEVLRFTTVSVRDMLEFRMRGIALDLRTLEAAIVRDDRGVS